MVHTHLLYGIAIWGNTFEKYLKKNSNAPSKAVKLIGGVNWRNKSTPLAALHNHFNWGQLSIDFFPAQQR